MSYSSSFIKTPQSNNSTYYLNDLIHINSLIDVDIDKAQNLLNDIKLQLINSYNPMLEGEYHLIQGFIYFRKGKLKRAITHLQKAYSISSKVVSHKFTQECLMKLGEYYAFTNQENFSIECYQTILSYAIKNDKVLAYRALTGLIGGAIYWQKFYQVDDLYSQAIMLNIEDQVSAEQKADMHLWVLRGEANIGRYSKSHDMLKKLAIIADTTKDTRIKYLYYLRKVELEYYQNKTDTSSQDFEKVVKYLKKSGHDFHAKLGLNMLLMIYKVAQAWDKCYEVGLLFDEINNRIDPGASSFVNMRSYMGIALSAVHLNKKDAIKWITKFEIAKGFSPREELYYTEILSINNLNIKDYEQLQKTVVLGYKKFRKYYESNYRSSFLPQTQNLVLKKSFGAENYLLFPFSNVYLSLITNNNKASLLTIIKATIDGGNYYPKLLNEAYSIITDQVMLSYHLGDNQYLADLYNLQSNCLQTMGKYDDALIYKKRSDNLKSSLFSTNITFTNIEGNLILKDHFNTKIKNQSISNQIRRLYINYGELLYLLVVFLFLTISILGYMYFRIRYVRKQEELKKIETIKTLELIIEKERYGKELKEEIQNTLKKMDAISQSTLSKFNEKWQKEALNAIKEKNLEVIDNIYEIIWELSPHNEPLYLTLKKLVTYGHEICKENNIEFICNIDSKVKSLHVRTEIRTNLYYILKEIINNCAKYSFAKRQLIDIVLSNQLLQISAVDDGVGFNPEIVKGNGVQNILFRAKAINSIITLRSHPGIGTEYKISIQI